MQGTVVAVGTGKVTEDGKIIPLQVKVGDTVIYGKYSGTEIAIERRRHFNDERIERICYRKIVWIPILIGTTIFKNII